MLVSPDGVDGSVVIHRDVRILGALLGHGERASHALAPGRHAWVQVVRGEVVAQGEALSEGDGMALSEEALVTLEGVNEAEVLLFDLD